MNIFRTLSIRDVGRAIKRREFGRALRISENLCSNATSTVRFHLRELPYNSAKRISGRG